jgi:hypothetical protein
LVCCKREPSAVFNVDIQLVEIIWAKKPQFEEIYRKSICLMRKRKMSGDPSVETRRTLLIVAIVQPGKGFPSFAGQLSEHVLESLALQMGHVVIQLSSQRLQRVAPGTTDYDFADQVASQLLTEHHDWDSKDVCRRLPDPRHGHITQDSQLVSYPGLQHLQQNPSLFRQDRLALGH